MSVEVYHGAWKILDCVNITNARNGEVADIIGSIFVLQENGEVRWEIEGVDKTFPLFNCDCYEVVHSFVGVSIQMGALSGHMFEFWIDRPVPRDMMLLTFENWIMLECQQLSNSFNPELDFPFSFLPAIEEGYFSDATITALSDNSDFIHKFSIHSVIMEMSEGSIEELKDLPSDVLETILHFFYSQSLPDTLTKDTVRKCIQFSPKGTGEFVLMCHQYLHRLILKQKIIDLVNDVHYCAEAMTAAFKDKSVTTPSPFCLVIKHAVRYAAVAFMKLIELCVLYGEEAPKLQRNERLEILRYAKTRLPIFLTQFVALLKNVKNDFATTSPMERNDIAIHVSPEIDSLLEGLVGLLREAKDACNEIWVRWAALGALPSSFPGYESPNEEDGSDRPDSLNDALYAIFRNREITKLHSLQSQVASTFLYLSQKKEHYEEMSTTLKVRCVGRNFEQLLEELPVFLLRLEEIMIAFDDRFQWKDFKFCLQLAISQVCQTVQHLRRERGFLQKFFNRLADLVQRDEFHQSLMNLGLLETNQEENDSQITKDKDSLHEEKRHKNRINSFYSTPRESDDLNLLENLCTPKYSKENILAANSAKLFNSPLHSDMIFEINTDEEKVEIPAHRVIVASRCDWFRRALLSGMKESIQKRIVVRDCSANVFKLFLKYIYTGQIGSEANPDVLADLIALADRYELDNLKVVSEQELAIKHLDENSVIYLLSMADQFNARTLRSSCMEYISANPGIMGRELFEELSPELQMEVYDITMWSKPHRRTYGSSDELMNCPRYMLVSDSVTSSSSGSTSPHIDDTGGGIGGHRSHNRHRHHHHHHHHSHHRGPSPTPENDKDNSEGDGERERKL